MKTLIGQSGQFAARPYYELMEIERICSDALKSVDLMPETPEAIRIERFVEKYFRVFPRYEPLPDGILGFTAFGKHGVQGVVVTAALDDEGSAAAERRIRSTLAHEGGHGLLHAHLFALGERPMGLFDDAQKGGPEIMCRDVHGTAGDGGGYRGKWWEFQANRAIGCLLMPRRLARLAAAPFCTTTGKLGLPIIVPERREKAARELAELFDVNPVVARFRLDEIFPLPKDGQLSL
jgi:hypothetical protein